MDEYALGKKLLGNEQTKEEKASIASSPTVSILTMIAVSSSLNGEVTIAPDPAESDDIWETGEEGVDYIELSEDGDFDEEAYDNVDDTDSFDDEPADMTFGDGFNIADNSLEVVVMAVSTEMGKVATFTSYVYGAGDAKLTYQWQYLGIDGRTWHDVEPLETSRSSTFDVLVTEETLDDYYRCFVTASDGRVAASGKDFILLDKGVIEPDRKSLRSTPIKFTPIDDNDPDCSDEPYDGKPSDGTTKVETTVSVRAGDRVLVAVQDGKMTVIGVVGGGDVMEAQVDEAQNATGRYAESDSMVRSASVYTQAETEYGSSFVQVTASADDKDENGDVKSSRVAQFQVGADSDGSTIHAQADKFSLGNGTTLSTEEGYVRANKPFRADLESATAKDNSAVSLQLNTYKVIPCTTGNANLSNFIERASDGMTFSKDGWVLVFGTVYCSDLGSSDVVSACIYHYTDNGSTQGPTARAGATKTSVSVHIPPTVLQVTAGETVKLAAANLSQAKGTAGGSIATSMTAIYLR